MRTTRLFRAWRTYRTRLTLSMVGVGADHVLGDRFLVLRETVAIEGAGSIPVTMLLVRGMVTFHGTFVLIGVGRFRGNWLDAHSLISFNVSTNPHLAANREV